MLCTVFGPPESLKLTEVDSLPVGKGQVRIAIHASGVNFPDTLIIQGKYQFKPEMPFAPGHEVSGEITEIGEGVSQFKVGDRVIAMTGHGGYADEVVANEAN